MNPDDGHLDGKCWVDSKLLGYSVGCWIFILAVYRYSPVNCMMSAMTKEHKHATLKEEYRI